MPFIFQFPATSGRTSGVMLAFHNLLMPWAISKACSKEKHHALDVKGISAIPRIFLPNIVRSSAARLSRHAKVVFLNS
ncbi:MULTISPECIES: hypothetical protein [Rhizobium]|uniref:hypothetical protein n=1 Tax=Rhizobium TaxID=379 RepID=UPI0003F97D2A|nr:hypothetical protein [Rhizobium leguminosarum]MBY5919315.1 hypothetical protein [Rhizobium leguminosarum]MDV4165528.1 hypothetical protein [Rhizobium leguminosarum]MDV4176002.1 hypothetical protein [Rhizobium leguminosarum]UIJ88682.1 hypothetical protein LZK77_12385 [Rhizobium leguminosarum]UIY26297.1 hypothetical protein LZK76_12965 [Rhizobium leguminosarum]